MKQIDLASVAQKLNLGARQHPIGELQRIRTNLKGLSRRPGEDVFSKQTTFEDGAFHHGGRRELQFNIWREDDQLRHGVAFSFERTQTLQRPVEVLGPKVRLFNSFLRKHPDLYRDMRMWHYSEGGRSSNYLARSIPKELVRVSNFACLGKLQRMDRLDYEAILTDFDRLLPLYTSVEGGGTSRVVSMSPDADFVFCEGCSRKKAAATVNEVQNQHQMVLRHNELQDALYRRLRRRYGAQNVGTECRGCAGTRVDAVVRRKNGYWFYEVKIADSRRACIREAMGQLLEYAFWRGAPKVTRLIVVGERALDDESKEYLVSLKKGFSLTIEYEKIVA
jgi:hypothetical protein